MYATPIVAQGVPLPGWERVAEYIIGHVSNILPSIVFLGLMFWMAVRVIQDIRDSGRLGWQEAAIFGGYFVLFTTLLTVPTVNLWAIASWAVFGILLLEIPKIFRYRVNADLRRARLAEFSIGAFLATMLALQLASGQYMPSWWQFPGVILGVIISFVLLADFSIYEYVFARKNRPEHVIPFGRRNQTAA